MSKSHPNHYKFTTLILRRIVSSQSLLTPEPEIEKQKKAAQLLLKSREIGRDIRAKMMFIARREEELARPVAGIRNDEEGAVGVRVC